MEIVSDKMVFGQTGNCRQFQTHMTAPIRMNNELEPSMLQKYMQLSEGNLFLTDCSIKNLQGNLEYNYFRIFLVSFRQ